MNEEVSPISQSVPPVRVNLQSLVARFAASLDCSEKTRAHYEHGVTRFLTWLNSSGITMPDRDTVVSYKRHLADSGLSANSVSAYIVAVRKFFEWTESVRLYPNIARNVKGARRTRGHRRDALTISQVRDLLAAIDTSTPVGKRDYALINLLVCTGIRTIEAIRSDVGDIRTEGGQIVLWVHGKGRDAKDEFVLLTDHVYRPILAYLSSRSAVADNLPLFASDSNRNKGGRLTTRTIRGIVKQHLRSIGLDSVRLTSHSLRHTTVTLALQAGASIQEARAMARHSSINTTMIYAHNLNRIENGAELRVDALLYGNE